MPVWLQWTLIITGLVAIGSLALFIRNQSRAIRHSRRTQARNEAFQASRRDSMIESIQVLAMAVEQDQVEYSEACLRIKGLLEHVAPELLTRAPFRIFQDMHDKMQHMPTHQARQDTDQRFVEKLDRERFALEQKHADEIRRAATAIRHYQF